MKKIKGHFCSPSNPSNPSHPSHQTRPVGLVVMCEHWTPKGDCKVTGNKERNYKMIEPKKSSPKNRNRLEFYKEIPLKIIWEKTKKFNLEIFT